MEEDNLLKAMVIPILNDTLEKDQEAVEHNQTAKTLNLIDLTEISKQERIIIKD